MGIATLSPEKYRALVAKALPKVIETDRELEHFAEMLESLDRLNRKFTAEEKALEALLLKLIQDYDDKVELPDGPPYRVVLHLMEHRGLRPVDMAPVFGSRKRRLRRAARKARTEQGAHPQAFRVLSSLSGSVFLSCRVPVARVICCRRGHAGCASRACRSY